MTSTTTPGQPETTPRSVLQTQVNTKARCASGVDPNIFFRDDARSDPTWPARRIEALQTCETCPVMAACRELALRNGDGTLEADDMVRGGMTGRQLAQARTAQATRLAQIAVVEADTEWAELVGLFRSRTELIQRGLSRYRPSGAPRSERVAQLEERDNKKITQWTDRIREIRADRRARTGWSTAA